MDWSDVDKRTKPVSARQGAVARKVWEVLYRQWVKTGWKPWHIVVTCSGKSATVRLYPNVLYTRHDLFFDIFDPCFKPIGVEIITLGRLMMRGWNLVQYRGERYDTMLRRKGDGLLRVRA